MDNEIKNDIVAMRQTMEELLKPQIMEANGTSGLVVYPENMNIRQLKDFVDKERQVPEVLKGVTELHTCCSFVEFANRYKTENSAIFYKRKIRRFFTIKSNRKSPAFLTAPPKNRPVLSSIRPFMLSRSVKSCWRGGQTTAKL